MIPSQPQRQIEIRPCPFQLQGRDCEYQETHAKDIQAAMQGDIIFVCVLNKSEDCPKLGELLDDRD